MALRKVLIKREDALMILKNDTEWRLASHYRTWRMLKVNWTNQRRASMWLRPKADPYQSIDRSINKTTRNLSNSAPLHFLWKQIKGYHRVVWSEWTTSISYLLRDVCKSLRWRPQKRLNNQWERALECLPLNLDNTTESWTKLRFTKVGMVRWSSRIDDWATSRVRRSPPSGSTLRM